MSSALGDVLGAGNRAVVKPSEVTPRTAKLMQELTRAFEAAVWQAYSNWRRGLFAGNQPI